MYSWLTTGAMVGTLLVTSTYGAPAPTSSNGPGGWGNWGNRGGNWGNWGPVSFSPAWTLCASEPCVETDQIPLKYNHPAPVCPANNGQYVYAPGSCACSFEVNCNVYAAFTQSTQFWERNSGELIGSLAECLEICNNNSECEAAIWTDNSTAPAFDQHHCFQTKGLGPINQAGFGQVSYKGKCWGECARDYINPPPPPPPSS